MTDQAIADTRERVPGCICTFISVDSRNGVVAHHSGPWPIWINNACPVHGDAAQATTDCEGSSATCQACGGQIEGWICQTCNRDFKENDAGNLVFMNPRGEGTEAATRIRAAIADLAGEAEAMSGGFDPENWSVEVKVTDLQAVLYAHPSGTEAPSVVGADAKVLTQSAGRVKTLGEALALYAKHGGTVVSPNDAAMVADDITIILAALSSAQTGQDQ